MKSISVSDPAVHRRRLGMPDALAACHTGVIEGYAVEGHVPARELKRLLAERPRALGLAVPAMPRGSPGMEAAVNDSYDVLIVRADGSYGTYASYGRK